MNLKQYLSDNYINKQCELTEMNDGYGWKITYGGNRIEYQTHMITEVGDDFVVIEDLSDTVPHLTIVPFACLTIKHWKR